MAKSRKLGRGKTYRKSYTRKGKRSQTRYKVSRTARALRKCPAGFIKRAAFTRRLARGRKSYVPEQCIRNVGAPGKGLRGGPGIGPLRKGELVKFGYSDVVNKTRNARHAALSRAVKAYGSLSVWRKLNAVQVYTRRLSPASSKVFKADMDWIRSKYGIKAF